MPAVCATLLRSGTLPLSPSNWIEMGLLNLIFSTLWGPKMRFPRSGTLYTSVIKESDSLL